MHARLTSTVLILVAVVGAGVVCPATAGNSFTNRPAFSNYTDAVDLGTWCGKGLAERYRALESSVAILPKCDSQQHFLQTWKSSTVGIVPSYVDMNKQVNGTFNSWFSTPIIATNPPSTNWSSSFPMLTVTGLIARSDLPTNYFTYTPWRVLGNPGPGADPYVQSGKTAADYGWQNVLLVITNLSATHKTSAALTNGVRTFVNASTNTAWGHSYARDFDELDDGCNGDWSTNIDNITSTNYGDPSAVCSVAFPDKTTNISGYGAAESAITYSETCASSYQASYFDFYGHHVCTWGIGGGDSCSWAFTSLNDNDDETRASSKQVSKSWWAGNAYCSVAVTTLSASVDFYEKIVSSGPSAQTDTWTYLVYDGFDGECGAPFWPLNHSATQSVVISLTEGIPAYTNWTKRQTKNKGAGELAVVFGVAYTIPALSAYSSGSYSYSDHTSADCPYDPDCGDYSSTAVNQTSTSSEDTYTRNIVRWNGYTPQTPKYLFRWNFNYN